MLKKALSSTTATFCVSLALMASASPLSLALSQTAAKPANQVAALSLPNFADLVERVAPTVASIRVSSKASKLLSRISAEPNPFRPTPTLPPSVRPDDLIPAGRGSGFIVSADGFILTNEHVVRDADEITVVLSDKREFKARLVGSDYLSDVAVLKIEATGLPVLRTGSVDSLRVGEWVIAIGSPFGFDQTVTKGIVSAKNRDLGNNLIAFIQTDAAVNSGNSGGPLINSRGEVVGINSMLISASQGFQGISLSIPIDEANRVAESIRSVGRMVRGRLGILPGDITKSVADGMGLPSTAGAVVEQVVADAPAARAGIRVGDVILKVDGKAIERALDLRRIVGATKPGSKVPVQIWQRGTIKELLVTMDELPDPRATAAANTPSTDSQSPSTTGNAGSTVLGLTVVELSAEKRRLANNNAGVEITAIAKGSAGEAAGLQVGDIILTVNQTDVPTVAKFNEEVAKLDRSKPALLLVWRTAGGPAQGRAVYVTIRPAAKN